MRRLIRLVLAGTFCARDRLVRGVRWQKQKGTLSTNQFTEGGKQRDQYTSALIRF